MIKRVLIIMSIVICSFYWVAESYSIIIGPARMEVRLPAGETAGMDYYAQNDTETPVHVVVEPENWVKGVYDYSKLPIEKWIKVDGREFDLKPMEIKKLRVTVKVPKDVKGELVAQIFFTSVPVGADEASGIRSRLGAVLYVAIKDTEKPVLEIRNISVTDVTGQDGNKLKIGVNTKNEGNVHIRPSSGLLNIFDEKGRRVAQASLLVDQPVLPGNELAYEAVLDRPELKQGKYSVYCDIKYGKMYGREKAAKLVKEFEIDNSGKVIIK